MTVRREDLLTVARAVKDELDNRLKDVESGVTMRVTRGFEGRLNEFESALHTVRDEFQAALEAMRGIFLAEVTKLIAALPQPVIQNEIKVQPTPIENTVEVHPTPVTAPNIDVHVPPSEAMPQAERPRRVKFKYLPDGRVDTAELSE